MKVEIYLNGELVSVYENVIHVESEKDVIDEIIRLSIEVP